MGFPHDGPEHQVLRPHRLKMRNRLEHSEQARARRRACWLGAGNLLIYLGQPKLATESEAASL